jgi:hypothetical protein
MLNLYSLFKYKNSNYQLFGLYLAAIGSFVPNRVLAIVPVSDQALSKVTAGELNWMFEGLSLQAGIDEPFKLSVNNLDSVSGLNDASWNIDWLYLTGVGSEFGNHLDNTFNFGRLPYPFTLGLQSVTAIGLKSESTHSVLNLSSPRIPLDTETAFLCGWASLCSSRENERFDLGMSGWSNFGGNGAGNHRYEFFLQSAAIDGSSILLWGDENALAIEADAHLYANRLLWAPCQLGNRCHSEDRFNTQGLVINGLTVEFKLGDFAYDQPLKFEVLSTGDLHIVLQAPEIADASLIAVDGKGSTLESNADHYRWYQNYYTNARTSSIRWQNLTLAGTNLGSSTIEGIHVLYLDVKTHP